MVKKEKDGRRQALKYMAITWQRQKSVVDRSRVCGVMGLVSTNEQRGLEKVDELPPHSQRFVTRSTSSVRRQASPSPNLMYFVYVRVFESIWSVLIRHPPFRAFTFLREPPAPLSSLFLLYIHPIFPYANVPNCIQLELLGY